MIAADEVVEEWHTWHIVDGVTTTDSGTADEVTWPQAYLGEGYLNGTECGEWYQQDRYVGTREEIDAIVADGKLAYGEDFDVVTEWTVTQVDCAGTPFADALAATGGDPQLMWIGIIGACVLALGAWVLPREIRGAR